ncbi:MAG: type II toxin-antitoxin system VapC family toxin [Opitutales bacterium]
MPPLGYLLDTSVYSQPLRKSRVESALRRWSEVGDHVCAISAVTVAEVEWGLYRQASAWMWELFEEKLKSRLRIFPTDGPVWSEFSRMKATQMALGRPVPDLDLLIAATAAHHGLRLATLNRRHFSLIQGLKVEDWSTP